MPDGDGIIRGKVDHRFCHEETEDLTLSGILSAKDLLIDLDDLGTIVDLSVHFRGS